jgi:hypothetical protein
MSKPSFALSAVILVVCLCAHRSLLVGSKDPESLFTSKDKKLNVNKQVVLHIMRDLLNQIWDEAPKYLSARYLQHNPMSLRVCNP